MAYFPKSKISIKETTGDEFIYSSTRKPYIGSYIEFSDGSYYAGKNPRKLGERIERPEEIPSTSDRQDVRSSPSTLFLFSFPR